MFGDLLAIVNSVLAEAPRDMYCLKLKKLLTRRKFAKLQKLLQADSLLYRHLLDCAANPPQIVNWRNVDLIRMPVTGPIFTSAFPFHGTTLEDITACVAVLNKYNLESQFPIETLNALDELDAAAYSENSVAMRDIVARPSVRAALTSLGVSPAVLDKWTATAAARPLDKTFRQRHRELMQRNLRTISEYDYAVEELEAAAARAASRTTAAVTEHIAGAADVVSTLLKTKARMTAAARHGARGLVKVLDDAAEHFDVNEKQLVTLYKNPNVTTLLFATGAMDDVKPLPDDMSAYDMAASSITGLDAPDDIEPMARIAAVPVEAGGGIVTLFEPDYAKPKFYETLRLVLVPDIAASVTPDDIEVLVFLGTGIHTLTEVFIDTVIVPLTSRAGEFRIKLKWRGVLPVHRVIVKLFVLGLQAGVCAFDCMRATPPAVINDIVAPASIRSARAQMIAFDVKYASLCFARKYDTDVFLVSWGHPSSPLVYPTQCSVEYVQEVTDQDVPLEPFAFPHSYVTTTAVVGLTDAGLVCNLFGYRHNYAGESLFISQLCVLPAVNARAFSIQKKVLIVLVEEAGVLSVLLADLVSHTKRKMRLGDGFRVDENMNIGAFTSTGSAFTLEFAYSRLGEVFGCRVDESGIHFSGPIFKPARDTDVVLSAFRLENDMYVTLGSHDRTVDVPGLLMQTKRPFDSLEVRKYDAAGNAVLQLKCPPMYAFLSARVKGNQLFLFYLRTDMQARVEWFAL